MREEEAAEFAATSEDMKSAIEAMRHEVVANEQNRQEAALQF